MKEKVLQICKEHQNQPTTNPDEKPLWLKEMYKNVKQKREYKDENDKKYHEIVDSMFNFPSKLYETASNYYTSSKDFIISVLPQTEQGRNQSLMALLILFTYISVQRYTNFISIFDLICYILELTGIGTSIITNSKLQFNKFYQILWGISFLFDHMVSKKVTTRRRRF